MVGCLAALLLVSLESTQIARSINPSREEGKLQVLSSSMIRSDSLL